MHLIAIQHGLWGHPSNTDYLAKLLESSFPSETTYVYNSDVNSKLLTYDGIDVCGQRFLDSILELCKKHEAEGRPFTKISLFGYSMGGLITRYVVGKLYAYNFFDKVTPVNFVTIATPHLGSWRLPVNIMAKVFNSMVPVVTSRSGYQLMLVDKHTWDRPILSLMSHPRLPFYRGIKLFKKRILLANIEYDRPVPYCTAAICLENPYQDRYPMAINPQFPSIVHPLAKDENGPDSKLPRRVIKFAWIRVMILVVVPLFIPILLYMTITGKGHHILNLKRKFDTQWIEDVFSSEAKPDPSIITPGDLDESPKDDRLFSAQDPGDSALASLPSPPSVPPAISPFKPPSDSPSAQDGSTHSSNSPLLSSILHSADHHKIQPVKCRGGGGIRGSLPRLQEVGHHPR